MHERRDDMLEDHPVRDATAVTAQRVGWSTSGWDSSSAANCAHKGSKSDTGRAGTGTSDDHGGVSNPMITGPIFARYAYRTLVPACAPFVGRS